MIRLRGKRLIAQEKPAHPVLLPVALPRKRVTSSCGTPNLDLSDRESPRNLRKRSKYNRAGSNKYFRIPNFFELLPNCNGIYSGNRNILRSQVATARRRDRRSRLALHHLKDHDVYVNRLLLTTRGWGRFCPRWLRCLYQMSLATPTHLWLVRSKPFSAKAP